MHSLVPACSTSSFILVSVELSRSASVLARMSWCECCVVLSCSGENLVSNSVFVFWSGGQRCERRLELGGPYLEMMYRIAQVWLVIGVTVL